MDVFQEGSINWSTGLKGRKWDSLGLAVSSEIVDDRRLPLVGVGISMGLDRLSAPALAELEAGLLETSWWTGTIAWTSSSDSPRLDIEVEYALEPSFDEYGRISGRPGGGDWGWPSSDFPIGMGVDVVLSWLCSDATSSDLDGILELGLE